ncbi:MAG: hypothetical protein AAF125_10170 [Chloroflexota bacterium]
MNFLKNLFGGGGGAASDGGMYFYIRPRGCEEVVQVRINPRNDSSLQDDGTYLIRKTVQGQHRCFNPAELTLTFNSARAITNQEVTGGEMLTEADFVAWQESLNAKKNKKGIAEAESESDAANEADTSTDD